VKHVAGENDLVPNRLSPEEARQKLWAAMRQPRPEEANLNVEHRVEEGDPAEEILRVAEETHCDVIVMGSHPKTGWPRWLLGGVAESVIRKAPCSVLVVKGTDSAVPTQPKARSTSSEEDQRRPAERPERLAEPVAPM
jgi:K+-sensing histidine kinase KdpD